MQPIGNVKDIAINKITPTIIKKSPEVKPKLDPAIVDRMVRTLKKFGVETEPAEKLYDKPELVFNVDKEINGRREHFKIQYNAGERPRYYYYIAPHGSIVGELSSIDSPVQYWIDTFDLIKSRQSSLGKH